MAQFDPRVITVNPRSAAKPALIGWKGIEATENLAKSPNSKIIVIGNSKNGLPLVMSGE
jgi:regulator of protease activity HflC (stomatin/prohibitin superfamily)